MPKMYTKVVSGQVWNPMAHNGNNAEPIQIVDKVNDEGRWYVLGLHTSRNFSLKDTTIVGHYKLRRGDDDLRKRAAEIVLGKPQAEEIEARKPKKRTQSRRAQNRAKLAAGQVWGRSNRSPVVINRIESGFCFVQPLEYEKHRGRNERAVAMRTVLDSYAFMFRSVLEYNESKRPKPEPEPEPTVTEVVHVQDPYASQEQLDAIRIAFADMMTDVMTEVANAAIDRIEQVVEAGFEKHLRSEQFKALIYDAINNALK